LFFSDGKGIAVWKKASTRHVSHVLSVYPERERQMWMLAGTKVNKIFLHRIN
jgi:hypothetical protein